MGYLLDRIRGDIMERIAEQDVAIRRALVVDLTDAEDGIQTGLSRQHPDAEIILLDWGKGMPDWTSLDGEDFDCVVINLQLAWDDFVDVVTVARDCLAPGGLLFFSSLGPDTLGEIADAWSRVDDHPHVFDFIDMHHLGDALVRLGFEKPIVDADVVRVEYDHPRQVMDDLRAEGLHNIREDRRKTLTGRRRFEAFCDELAGNRGNLAVTFEIIHGFGIRGASPDRSGSGIRVDLPSLD